jgi:hypothetical protein
VFFSWASFSQNTEDNQTMKESIIEIFIDHIQNQLQLENSIGVTSHEFWLDFDKLPEPILYDNHFFDSIYKRYEKDSTNGLIHQQLAIYYSSNEQVEKSQHHYQLALKYLNHEAIGYDSALFYSFRGVIKMNLNDSTYMSDFKQALEINPKDTLSMVFYPMALIMNDDYEEANLKLSRIFLNGGDEFIYYFFIRMNDFYQWIRVFDEDQNVEELDVEKSIFDDFRHADISLSNKDFQLLIDEQFNLLRLLYLADPFNLYQHSRDEISKSWKKSLDNHIKSKIRLTKSFRKKGVINDYLYHKNQGYYYLFLRNNKKSTKHFREALNAFPSNRRDKDFNENAIYSTLIELAIFEQDFQLAHSYLDEFFSDEGRMFPEQMELNRFCVYMRSNDFARARKQAIKLYESGTRKVYPMWFIGITDFAEEKYDRIDQLIGEIENEINSNQEYYEALSFLAGLHLAIGEEEDGMNFLIQADRFNQEEKINQNEAEALHLKIIELLKKYTSTN